MRNQKKRAKKQQKALRDAAAGIKRGEGSQQPPTKQTAPSAVMPAAPLAMDRQRDPPREREVGPGEPENAQLDPRYPGHCDQAAEDPECFVPEIVKDMEREERATWLGKWFAHHYGAWVSILNMRELENYQPGQGQAEQDPAVSPLPMLHYSFRRFQIPDDEWRSPSFCAPFRLGLRRFRYEIVSTLRTHAIRIFNITDIMTIDDRDESEQVAALHKEDSFLYAGGDSRRMERYLRSDCVVKALRVVLLGPAALEDRDQNKSPNVRAILFGVLAIRDTLVAFVATVLWFLLVDGGAFLTTGGGSDCQGYYHEQMKSLAKMANKVPELYASYKKFLKVKLFGNEEEMADKNEDRHTKFASQFDADLEEELQQKPKENPTSGGEN